MVLPAGSHSLFTSGAFLSTRGWQPDPDLLTAGASVPTVQVTAKWGYAVTVPDRVKQACIIQAARWFKRGEGGWSDSLANADLGTLEFRKVLDPDLELILKQGRLIKPATGRR
jgi:hypothetical protein